MRGEKFATMMLKHWLDTNFNQEHIARHQARTPTTDTSGEPNSGEHLAILPI